MDFTKVPTGFGLALVQDKAAMARYAALNEEEKQALLARAHNVRSEKEMRQIVSGIAAM